MSSPSFAQQGIVYDDLTQFVVWGQQTLDITIVMQVGVTWVLPSVGFFDRNNNGFSFSVNTSGDPAFCSLALHRVVGGGGSQLASSPQFAHGGAIKTVRMFDDGTDFTFFVDGLPIGSVLPSFLPYDQGLEEFRRFGNIYVTANNAERIYSVTVLAT
jgi:hypothetical protein